MTKKTHFLRFLLSGMMMLAPLTIPALHAQDEEPQLKVIFTDGTQSLIGFSTDLHMAFDSENICILQNDANPRSYRIEDVSSFSYQLGILGVGAVNTDSEPVIRFSADGLDISMAGNHSYRLYNINGSTLLNGNFIDTVTLNLHSIQSGVVVLQIDQNKTFKFIVE